MLLPDNKSFANIENIPQPVLRIKRIINAVFFTFAKILIYG